MSHIQIYEVFPTIPEPLSFLVTLGRNLWWCWKKDAKELFRRIDLAEWEASGRNPVVFLNSVNQGRLEDLAADDSFLAHLHRVQEHYRQRVETPSNAMNLAFGEREVIAYLSMEFGIHESLPLFAGGLGILAGDHLKSASNLSLPLVGICLLYQKGYFRQFLDPAGLQQEAYPETDIFQLPLEKVTDRNGNDLRISVQGPEGALQADVWKVRVGCVDLLLLDANIQDNPPEIREVTASLYPGDGKTRLAQEMLLGIGGMRALQAMGLHPKVCHMNEGHSAFSAIERLADTMKRHQVDLKTAMEIVPRATVFTTHTPVAAGHDEFPPDLVRPYLIPFEAALGTGVDEILSWGQATGSGPGSPFSMFVVGVRMSQYCNGVSRLHGRVARRMWSYLWPERPEEEVPIDHITNGVHISSFISQEFSLLFDRYLGPEWYMGSRKPENIKRIDDIYDEELWRAHEFNRSRLIRTCRERMKRQYAQRNAPLPSIEQAEMVLDPDVLTIGFARRFAAYKRATLLLQDPDRLEGILTNRDRPMQFIFAGKAHPKDNEGKELIKRIVEFARRPSVRDRFVFIEDYDMHLARHLVQGCDVWLNNPLRPFEACGTSGMKAAVNGVINVSILDGWWCEGYSEDVGWAIGHGEEFEDRDYQDAVESQALYNLLENDVVGCFYDRRNGESPACWMKKMKASMKMAMEHFCSLRMVADYVERYYQPAAQRMEQLIESDCAEARRLVAQNGRFETLWEGIGLATPESESNGPFRVGDRFRVHTEVTLGEIRPEEVEVELYFGPLKSVDSLKTSHIEPMQVQEALGKGRYRYGCEIECHHSGRYGFTARIVPQGDDRLKFTPGRITWA
ncbi:MAG: alpha-glucan family phosphorylase [Desulfobacteraceae bacterium]|nr:alpha-glucan family phosphorylase [Desulfobacteraceae bacterium]